MTTGLLGIQIAHGFSPEARIFASLLQPEIGSVLNPQVLFHCWNAPSAVENFLRFQGAAQAEIHPLDFGWRSIDVRRSFAQKVRARLHFQFALPRALSVARTVSPAVIYSCQQQWDCSAATFLARKLQRPQIIHLHYTIGEYLHRPVLERLLTCAHVIAISDFIREQAISHGVPAARITTIRNTLAVTPPPPPGTREAIRASLGIALNAPLIGMIARLDPQKGQTDTLRAFAQIAPRFPDARLLIVGSESPWHVGYKKELEKLAQELEIGEKTKFLGKRDDVEQLLTGLDIFSHPSRNEPFGLATAEASASNLPVVGYDEGGMAEIVQHDKTGLLAAPGDVGGLSCCLANLITDPARARHLGNAGRARIATEFRPEDAASHFAALVKQIGNS